MPASHSTQAVPLLLSSSVCSSAFYTRRGVLWGVCAGNTGFARCRCVAISVCCARGAVGAQSTRHVRVLADGAVVTTSSLVRKLHVFAGAADLALCGRVIIVIRLSGGTINAGRCRFLSIAARMAVSAQSALRSHSRVLAGGAVHAGRTAVVVVVNLARRTVGTLRGACAGELSSLAIQTTVLTVSLDFCTMAPGRAVGARGRVV